MSQSSSRIFNALSLISLVLAAAALGVAVLRQGPAGPAGAASLPGPRGATGPPGATGPAGPAGVSWKTGSYYCTVSAQDITNCASLSFTAPQDGFVWLQSSGTCYTYQGPSATSLTIGWTNTASNYPDNTVDATFTHATGSPTGYVYQPYTTSKEFSVVGGANTFYLNAYTDTQTAGSGCYGSDILMFTTSHLA